jgi:hypothetical protein
MMRRGRHPVPERAGLAPLTEYITSIRLLTSIARYFRERNSRGGCFIVFISAITEGEAYKIFIFNRLPNEKGSAHQLERRPANIMPLAVINADLFDLCKYGLVLYALGNGLYAKFLDKRRHRYHKGKVFFVFDHAFDEISLALQNILLVLRSPGWRPLCPVPGVFRESWHIFIE